MKHMFVTFNWASAECVPEAELLAAESLQWFCPPGPDAVNILAAAKVWKSRIDMKYKEINPP